ncbi:tripartite motif-containing protein 3-like [Branchiostoma floridae]|uniref:RING-type E3 ubiquitin transferase n=1 Tax=Branchiostoma floridae TaxID=7739 RepID=A0A9J7KV60_BRAFL|nr:tripartite motif-containing protein 3-like [Branchiostoma floridae]
MASPQSSLGEQIREELSCSICLDLFSRPKVLPCMHTFCQDCLGDHARARQPFECPNCRLQVTLPTQGVPGLPDNHLVANLCERISKQVKLPVKTPDQSQTQPENKCIFHPWEELKLYCEQCQLSVCTECMGDHHAGHRTTTPKKASQERRAAIQELVSEGRNLLETYFTFLRSLRDKEKVLHKHRQQTDKNIYHNFNEMLQMLINMKDSLLSEVDQTHRQNMTAIEGQREMVLTQVAELAAVCDSAEDRLRQGGMDLPGQERSLTQVIGKYRTKAPLSLVPIQTRAAVFHPSDTRKLELGQVSFHSVRSPSISSVTSYTTGAMHNSEYNLQGDGEKDHHQFERTTFGGKGSEQGEFDRPFGVAVSEDGEIFVADRGNQRIQIFTLQGTFVSQFVTVISGGQNISPQNVAVDTEGNLWVVGNHGVADFAVLYTREGKVLTTIDLQQTRWSRGVAIDTRRNNIIVTQTMGEWGFCCGEVQVFRPDGKLVKTIGKDQGMKNPEYITVDSSGNILVSDCENSSVYVYDEDTNFLFSFGGEGSREGQLTYPRGICSDSSGNIVVADWGNSCVQLFDRRGRFLKHINTDIRQPWAVAMAPHGQLIVTDDTNNTVTIFPRY